MRLLRDKVVIHEGKLKTLKRFKDDVREVQVGHECGMVFEDYEDIREGDVIEIFEIEERRAPARLILSGWHPKAPAAPAGAFAIFIA